MDMFVTAKYDLYVWDYCKENFLLTVAIPKCICVSIRIFDMGPMRKYASYMLFLLQTRLLFQINIFERVYYCEIYSYNNGLCASDCNALLRQVNLLTPPARHILQTATAANITHPNGMDSWFFLLKVARR